ncbi:N-acetyltransferase [Zooshikella marina]|uniref:GNAT family N-acetyltransferase n=1 Tax=Zooshikella ganghwensis TaxID=202772 RepID=UPI001BAF2D70|nr:GNAT family N-acetyltransferase [Zooshikella ganghwensis]MBU2705297.1 N-acetyltransferase [Zooshikella ganghwensis]
MEILVGKRSHVEAITEIFNHYILTSNARFEEEIFTYKNRLEWFLQFNHDTRHQIYVAQTHNEVLGFACSQPYRPSMAFSETVEVTIYLRENAKGAGIGTALYTRLFSALSTQRVHRALCGIASPNDASVNFHRRFGFSEVGVFNEYAKKRGEYISAIWLEKMFI